MQARRVDEHLVERPWITQIGDPRHFPDHGGTAGSGRTLERPECREDRFDTVEIFERASRTVNPPSRPGRRRTEPALGPTFSARRLRARYTDDLARRRVACE